MECKEISSDSIIVFQDRNSKAKMCFSNPSRRTVQKIRVDNCLIVEGKRCDFLLVDENNIEYFIELKGSKVEYACKQIIETMGKISRNIGAFKYAFIVSSACPLTTTEVQIQKVKFKRNYNAQLQVKNLLCNHCLV
jgi:hypothetical protein